MGPFVKRKPPFSKSSISPHRRDGTPSMGTSEETSVYTVKGGFSTLPGHPRHPGHRGNILFQLVMEKSIDFPVTAQRNKKWLNFYLTFWEKQGHSTNNLVKEICRSNSAIHWRRCPKEQWPLVLLMKCRRNRKSPGLKAYISQIKTKGYYLQTAL